MSIKFKNVDYVYAPETPFQTQGLSNISFEIKDGSLSRYLVKPVNHMLYWISMLIGDKFINVIYVYYYGSFKAHKKLSE